jgi:very-short-patch-repair endonuclease
MSRLPRYDDGLDADGYPLPAEPWRKPYIHGDESEAGDFKPVSIGEISIGLMERLQHFVQLSGSTDSPIETHVGAAVLMLFARAGKPLKLCQMIDVRKAADELLLVPQFAWSHYRSDWAILNPRRAGALLIECDGKDYHSTVNQIAHDNRKDAAALERGYLTMRFTGSQIHRDADGCAQKIYDAVHG